MVTVAAADVLARVTAALPGGGEDRPGQRSMLAAVVDAIERRRHLVVQAGTGTGKSLAYLIPLVLSGRRTVVATATKALQDQLATKDLPALQASSGLDFHFSVLKGRSNYLCRQRVAELHSSASDQLELAGVSDRASADEIAQLLAWGDTTDSGDRAELAVEPSPAAWEAVSVGVRECPGASRCPQGDECFAEAARIEAEAADVVVVNTHLYGLHLASRGAVLPEHDLVVIDEAHQLEDTMSATAGFTLAAGRFVALARSLRSVVADDALANDLEHAGRELSDALAQHLDQRLDPAADIDVGNALVGGRERLERALIAARKIPADTTADVRARATRVMQVATALADEVDTALELPAVMVAWVDGSLDAPTLRVAPIEVSDALQPLWTDHTAVLTSATLGPGLPDRLGLPEGTYTELDVGSPFDFATNGLLYCAAHLPDPRSPDRPAALHAELERLIVAAGGRTLALFTSWRAMTAAAEYLEPRLPWPVLTQRDMPKAALLQAFSTEPEACLFATMSFWQGVDVPGPSLSLVTIDRLPFPRPDDPLLEARRERVGGGAAFRSVDLPRAATLLAQGAGRLIRQTTDTGVVAVLDPRLATKRSYRWDLIAALPPFRRTRDHDEVVTFLRELR